MINRTITKKTRRKKRITQKKERGRNNLQTGALLVILLALFVAAMMYRGKEMRAESSGSREITSAGAGVTLLPSPPTAATDLEVSAGEWAGGDVTYQWKRNNEVIGGESTARLARTNFAKGDIISVTVVSGGREETASVEIANSRPKVSSISFAPEIPTPGSELSAAPVAVDEDGDYVRFTYAWSVNGSEIGVNSAALPGNAFKKGDRISVAVLPFDADGDGLLFVSDPLTTGNTSPRFVSTPASTFSGTGYSYTAVAVDPDGDPLAYSLAQGPQGMKIDSASGVVTWQIDSNQAGTHTIEIVAKDPDGLRAFQKYSFTVAFNKELLNEAK